MRCPFCQDRNARPDPELGRMAGYLRMRLSGIGQRVLQENFKPSQTYRNLAIGLRSANDVQLLCALAEQAVLMLADKDHERETNNSQKEG